MKPLIFAKRNFTFFCCAFFMCIQQCRGSGLTDAAITAISPGSGHASSNTWTGMNSADWNTGGNWSSGTVPDPSSDVIIPSGTPNQPYIKTANALANSIILNSGTALTMQNGYNLTITSGGFFENDGAGFTASGTGAVIFSGSGTVKGTSTTSFNNLTINGAFTVSTSPTITGSFQINGITSTVSAAVTYGSSSTLIYNPGTGNTFTTGNEWNAGSASTLAAGLGIPQHVTIQTGIVNIAASGGTADRAIAGNLFIAAGTIFRLSATVNHNLYLLGNWTNNGGTLIANSRTVSFIGGADQTITGNTVFYSLTENQTGSASLIFAAANTTIAHDLTISGGTMSPNNNTLVEFTGTGNLAGSNNKTFYDVQIDNTATMMITSGGVSIAHNFVNNGSYTYSGASRLTTFGGSGITQSFSGSATSLTIFGKVVVGDNHNFSSPIMFNCTADYTIQGGSLSLSNGSTLNNTGNTVIFSAAAATVSGTGTVNFNTVITNIALDPGTNTISSIINKILQINTGGSVINHAPVYAATSTLIYNTTSIPFTNNYEWSNNNTTPGLGVPANVSITNTNSVAIAGDRTVPGALNLTAGNLDINNNTLTVNGGFTGAGGNLKGSVTSNLTAGGTGTINFNAAANYLKNLNINGSANLALGNALNITASNGSSTNSFGTVTVGLGGIIDATSNGYLTLKSDTYGDAMVGQSSGTINGNVTVERYIPKVIRAWHFLSMPFSTSSTETLNQAWQEGATPYPYADNSAYSSNPLYNPKPGYGTEITFDNCTCNGYDVNITYNPSLKIWDYSTSPKTWSTYAPHTNTTKITDYPAYCLFVRGDRSVNLSLGATSATLTATTLRATGNLNEAAGASVPVSHSLNNNDFLFVGNPYASPVDFTKLQFSNTNPTYFYVWDPKIGSTGNGVGAYVTYSTVGGWSPTGGSYFLSTLPVIQSGQAFFVQANATGTSSVTFPQSSKSLTQFSTEKQLPKPVLSVQLVVPDDSMKLTDGVTVVFGNNFSSGRDEFDAPKLWNFTENLALQRDTNYFAIEARPMIKLTDTIFLKLYLYKNTAYGLRIFSINMFANMPTVRAWLVDKYLNTKTEINLNDTTLYNFIPNPDTMSYRNRFMIVFNSQFTATPVPVTKTTNQNNPNIAGVANSVIVKASGVAVYPNPASTNHVMLQFNAIDKGSYETTVYNSKGQKLATYKLEHSGGDNIYSILLNPSWAAGLYTINVMNENSKKTLNLKLVINR